MLAITESYVRSIEGKFAHPAHLQTIDQIQILQKRKEVQTQTFQRRRLYNQQLRELAQSARSLHQHSVPFTLYDQTALSERVRSSVSEVVRQQVDAGVDIVSDGE